MPMNRTLYPRNWESIALSVKTSANWTCQNCTRPCRKPGESIAALASRVREWPDAYEEVNSGVDFGDWVFKRGRFLLTAAHLNHRPSDCRPENLRAWCAPCHCRYDLSQMELKKSIKLELLGQLRLFPDLKECS
jgi:hypothetical protein